MQAHHLEGYHQWLLPFTVLGSAAGGGRPFIIIYTANLFIYIYIYICINPARGPRSPELAVSLPYGISPLRRREGLPPLPPNTPPTPCHQKPMRFTVFFTVPIFSHFSEFVAEDGSTWANIGLKMGQHRPTYKAPRGGNIARDQHRFKMGPT